VNVYSFFCLFLWLVTLKCHAQWVVDFDQSIPVNEDGNQLTLAWAGGLNSGQYYNLDINLDGQQDLLVFDRASQQFAPFILQHEQYRYAPEFIPLFPSNAQDFVIIADFDADGRKDLFTYSGRRSITVFRNVSRDHLAWQAVADPLTSAGINIPQIAIQVNGADMPTISDVDSDGDLDIITFDANGRGFLEYYQNMGIERHGTADSLDFAAPQVRWGGVQECDCNSFVFDGQSCADAGRNTNARAQHVAAKALLVLDTDHDGDKDLFVSDEGCGVLYYMENIGSAGQAQFNRFSVNYLTVPKDINPIEFPAVYWVDATGDGTNDLVIASNEGNNTFSITEWAASSWLFENTGTNQQPAFNFQTNQFLQSQMLDVGANAVPVLADYDADGDIDLFVSHAGLSAQDAASSLYLYENTGSQGQPFYELINSNFAELSQLNLQQMKVYFADLNTDGLPDLLVSGSENPFLLRARLYYLENQANGTKDWMFDPELRQVIDLELNYGDYLNLLDVDLDGDLDLLLARQFGNLEYYVNESDSNTILPDWQLENEMAGGIDASVFRRSLSTLLFDIDNDQKTDLISIDDSGVLSVRYDFVNQMNGEVKADTAVVFAAGEERLININLGKGSSLAATRLNNQGKSLLYVGSAQGGIKLLRYAPETKKSRVPLLVYPNPAKLADEVRLAGPEDLQLVQLISLSGAIVWESEVIKNKETLIDVSGLSKGIYLIRTWTASGGASTVKLLIE